MMSSGSFGVPLEIWIELARNQVEYGHVLPSMPRRVLCDQYVINTKEVGLIKIRLGLYAE